MQRKRSMQGNKSLVTSPKTTMESYTDDYLINTKTPGTELRKKGSTLDYNKIPASDESTLKPFMRTRFLS